MDEWARYDELDVESVVMSGYEEREDMDAKDAAFLRGYFKAAEL